MKLYNLFFIICSLIIVSRILYFNIFQSSSHTIQNDLVRFLQDYIKINTAQPNPDYRQTINFLTSHAQHDGFKTHVIHLPSKKPVLVITYPGVNPDLPSLVLNHHMDVVPAGDGWKADPFAGIIINNEIIGRGTQDMKGIGAVHYCALKKLKECNIIPQRTIHLVAVPDEEIGGFTGTQEFIKTDFFKTLKVGFILDEGHASGNPKAFDLKVSERKPIQIKVFGQGEQAHGSKLQSKNIIHELISFLNDIKNKHAHQQSLCAKHPAGILLSLNITSLQAGFFNNGKIALNIVPHYAQATIDIRVPPQVPNKKIIEKLENMLKNYPNLSYTIEAQALQERYDNNYFSPLYYALENTTKKFGFSVIPHYFEASSDLRFYLEQEIDGIGFTPFTVHDNIHGINESVPLDQLEQARDIMIQFLIDFCEKPNKN